MGKQSSFLSSSVHKNWLRDTGVRYRPGELVGVEIELEGLGGRQAPYADGWTAVADGSLRDGIEYISNGPKTVDELSTDLDVIQTAFTAANFTPVFSFRTSVHVHVNVQDLSVTQVLNYYVLYTIFEAALLQMGGEERIGNVHCMPVSMTQGLLDRIRVACEDSEDGEAGYWDNFRRILHRDYRYASCNLASLAQHGTLEFRSHRGTLDKTSIMTWVNTLLAMRKAATTFSSPIEIVQEFSKQGLLIFSNSIFNRDFVNNFVFPQQQAIWEGLRFAQFVAFSRKNWPAPKKVDGKKKTVVAPEDSGQGFVDPTTGQLLTPDNVVYGTLPWARVFNVHGDDPNHWIHNVPGGPLRVPQPVANPRLADIQWNIAGNNNIGIRRPPRQINRTLILDDFN